MGRQAIPHGRRCVHEGSFAWDDTSIGDVVFVDSSSGDHGCVGFQDQEVGGDGDIAVLNLVHHQNACLCSSFLKRFPLELGFHT